MYFYDRIEEQSAMWWSIIVSFFVASFITVRFFTETFPILPRFFNGLDLLGVPILSVIFFTKTLVTGQTRFKGTKIIKLGFLFLMVWMMAWFMNFTDVHRLAGVLFAAGLMLPILFYIILTNLKLGRYFCRRILLLLEWLLFINLVVGSIDAGVFVQQGRHDFVFGTFGFNNNQMAFFLASMIAYLLGRWRYEGIDLWRFVMLCWSAGLFLLCTFQTLWLVFVIAWLIVFVVLGRISLRVLLVPICAIPVVITIFTVFEFGHFNVFYMLNLAVEQFDDIGKVRLVKSIPEIWEDRPMAPIWGVGPGTFNSRAFRAVAIIPGTGGVTDVSSAVFKRFYTSELSEKYIFPSLRGQIRLSGLNTDGPFTSYISIPMEVGLLGAAAVFGIYVFVFIQMVKTLRRSRDPRQLTLATWGLMTVLLLLGISLVDNFLEATRYTMLTWLSVAVWRIYKYDSMGTSQ